MISDRDWLSPKVQVAFCSLPSLPEPVVHVLRFLKTSRGIFISVPSATQGNKEALFPELYSTLGYVLTILAAFGENTITRLSPFPGLLANNMVENKG